MAPSPFIGVVLIAVAGILGAICFTPFKGIKKWSWETYWLVNAFVGWMITAWVMAYVTCPHLLRVFSSAPGSSILLSYFFGLLWGIGGLSFGLSLRFLGWSLGYALVLGFSATVGTLVPPILHGEFSSLISTVSGVTTLGGVAVCLAGIAICGKAGVSKERELTSDEKKATIAEFNFSKGAWVALLSGVGTGCFALGIDAGKPIAATAVQMGTSPWWQYSPVFMLVLAGGFTVNLIYCLYLGIRNGTISDYIRIRDVPWGRNLLFAAVAGFFWYQQLTFYGLGRTRMGRYDFSSWTIYQGLLVVFSTLVGVLFLEWRGTSKRTRVYVLVGILVLLASAVVIGLGNYIGMLKR